MLDVQDDPQSTRVTEHDRQLPMSKENRRRLADKLIKQIKEAAKAKTEHALSDYVTDLHLHSEMARSKRSAAGRSQHQLSCILTKPGSV